MRIHAINRRGASDEPADWIGTQDRLDEMLRAADVLVIAAPLTRATEGAIDARRLGLMKEHAILINLARGEIVDEAALYAHLRGASRLHRLHRRVVGRADAAQGVPHGPSVPRSAERDRLAA